jgi:hypothetical protein
MSYRSKAADQNAAKRATAETSASLVTAEELLFLEDEEERPESMGATASELVGGAVLVGATSWRTLDRDMSVSFAAPEPEPEPDPDEAPLLSPGGTGPLLPSGGAGPPAAPVAGAVGVATGVVVTLQSRT